jgi:hypothetical protein
VELVGPGGLPETLASLERVLAAGPSREEVLDILDISRRPAAITEVLSSIDKASSDMSIRALKKQELAAIRKRAKQSNITYNKVHEEAPSPPVTEQALQTVLNPVTGQPLGTVHSDGSFHPLAGPAGPSPRPAKYHPRTHNAVGALTDEFADLLLVSRALP